MEYKTLRVERDGGVLTIILHRPEGRYAITVQGLAELGDALEASEYDGDVRAIVITSNSKAFCVGADMDMLDRVSTQPSAREIAAGAEKVHERVILRIVRMAKPLIAAVNGVAAGGGLGLALACDMRIAADTARFVMAYGNIAISPDMGASFFLPRLLGPTKALELYLLNEGLSAEQALNLGIVNRVVPAAELMSATRELAQRLGSGPTFAFGETKALIYNAASTDLASHLHAEAHSVGLCMTTEDHHAAVQSFIAKRPPVFHGR